MKKIIVAIDGYSSCGKSTMAKALAKEVGYAYIDTGAMYRAVALFAKRLGFLTEQKIDEERLKKALTNIEISFRLNKDGVSETFLGEENVEKMIRNMEMASGASRVSELKFVRQVLVAQRQAMGIEKGIVMDGRDIGTVVFPQAELKIFVTATPEIRAKRRYEELVAKGESVVFEEVLQGTIERDYRDTHRVESPLVQAADALILDNSEMSLAEQQEWLKNRFFEVCNE
jgi:cytidylate kinase